MQHQNKKTSSTVKEQLSTGESFSKKIAQCRLKNISRLFHDRCRLLSFQFIPWTKFALYQLGKVWSASCCEASFLDLDQSCFLADVNCHFFSFFFLVRLCSPQAHPFFCYTWYHFLLLLLFFLLSFYWFNTKFTLLGIFPFSPFF